MKAIGIKMVDLQPMTAKEAFDKGYGMKPNQDPNGDGYEVTYVDPSRYDMNIGKKFAKEKAVDAIWAGLGFVLQWAKFGLNKK